MASITKTIIPSDFSKISCRSRSGFGHVLSGSYTNIRYCNVQQDMCSRLLFLSKPLARGVRCLIKPVSAVGRALETSITDGEEDDITAISLENAKIVVESQDEDKIQLRVDVTGKDTIKVYDEVLADLASTAPPTPGFRKQKGGKTSQVPTSVLLKAVGEERLTKFVIQEIVSSTMADYVDKENLNVKEKKVDTTQTIEELQELFRPGKKFGFNVVLELEKSETETSDSTSSDSDM